MKIGAILSLYRDIETLNIRDFAKELGISAATLSRLENGENMDGETLAKIIKWLLD